MLFEQAFSTEFKHEFLGNSQTFQDSWSKIWVGDTVEYTKDMFLSKETK